MGIILAMFTVFAFVLHLIFHNNIRNVPNQRGYIKCIDNYLVIGNIDIDPMLMTSAITVHNSEPCTSVFGDTLTVSPVK